MLSRGITFTLIRFHGSRLLIRIQDRSQHEHGHAVLATFHTRTVDHPGKGRSHHLYTSAPKRDAQRNKQPTIDGIIDGGGGVIIATCRTC